MSIVKNALLKCSKFVFYFIIILEVIFQLLFYTNNSIYEKPILFYNPYCDQQYWNGGNSSYNKEIYSYHPALSIVKKSQFLDSDEKSTKDNNLIFYGSSFIDHNFFIKLFNKNKNYAVKSYGIDQIYLSYLLTKDKFYGDTVVFGFLPEDLDRILFDKRNYNKVKYIERKEIFIPTNIPIDPNKETRQASDFFTYRFLKSISYLLMNNFDYKKSTCKAEFKKKFFTFFLQNIKNESKKNNQNLIFVTFSFHDEINSKPSWRYNFIKQSLKKNNIVHVDTKKIIESDIKKNQSKVEEYYSQKDLHYNERANKIVADEIKRLQSYISKGQNNFNKSKNSSNQ
jgi:hypothetical protein